MTENTETKKAGSIPLEAAREIFAGVSLREIVVDGLSVGYEARNAAGRHVESNVSLTELCKALWRDHFPESTQLPKVGNPDCAHPNVMAEVQTIDGRFDNQLRSAVYRCQSCNMMSLHPFGNLVEGGHGVIDPGHSMSL